MFCQLETLRYCLPPSIRRTLDELPESLDETYERVLKEIKKPNRDHARRLLQCLVVAIRPLRVEELAEVLAVDFDDGEGIPRWNPNWRWEDEEQALLTSCSSLISIIETDDSRIVQFSHFSVKEFLTSTRFATSSKDVSRYHIDLEPAHTVLAQACMGVLLQRDDCNEESGVERHSSLARYAAQHWVTHAQFKSVSSSLRKAMEYLFDLDKPYFAAWLELHDMDTRSPSPLSWIIPDSTSRASPLYYAALCGFQGLVEDLVVKYPQYVNASGGHYITPLVVALAEGHFQTAKLLHLNGASADVRGYREKTPLFCAAWNGDLKMVQTLLDCDADVNAQDYLGWTSMHAAASQSWPDVARLLFEHGADVNRRHVNGGTPLHISVNDWKVAVMPVLLKHGANVDAEDKKGRTPLHEAARYGKVEVVRVLLEHGANVDTEDKKGRIPLHEAAWHGTVEVVRMLLEHGANVDAEDEKGRTPLHEAMQYRSVEVVRMLLDHGANVGAEDKKGRTPYGIALVKGYGDIVELLSDYGAGVLSISTSSLCLPW